MTRRREPSAIQAVITELRHLLTRLERLAGDARPLDVSVRDVLIDCDLSTAAIASVLHRRRGDVRTVVNLLAAAGEIERIGSRWRLL